MTGWLTIKRTNTSDVNGEH